MHGVLVSHKCLLKFLSSHVISTTTIACVYTACPCLYPSADTCDIVGICENHCMILYVYIGDVADAGGVLTFYIPAIIDDDP